MREKGGNYKMRECKYRQANGLCSGMNVFCEAGKGSLYCEGLSSMQRGYSSEPIKSCKFKQNNGLCSGMNVFCEAGKGSLFCKGLCAMQREYSNRQKVR